MFELLLAQVMQPVATPYDPQGTNGVLIPIETLDPAQTRVAPSVQPTLTPASLRTVPSFQTGVKPQFVLNDFTPKGNHPNLEYLKFDFNTSFEYNNCLQSILYYVASGEESSNPCLSTVRQLFGDTLTPATLFDIFLSADYRGQSLLRNPAHSRLRYAAHDCPVLGIPVSR